MSFQKLKEACPGLSQKDFLFSKRTCPIYRWQVGSDQTLLRLVGKRATPTVTHQEMVKGFQKLIVLYIKKTFILESA